ncbi:toxin biosynthesis protein [Colletotrichum truncatum]|uniref:Toxin biosynthesis protein n=1 Tax=Colletotrichum truncatum TaxID=5467 RepID=A0ACC3ZCU4_COLTU|nr:toxin biosynthesis protein [Colletotrichum truncatum]KAF6797885.1 toxin biosynthesis protein [Colletotrichum truncatum]
MESFLGNFTLENLNFVNTTLSNTSLDGYNYEPLTNDFVANKSELQRRYDAYIASKESSPWSAYIWPVSIYIVGLSCVAAAINAREKHRAPFVFAFMAIGFEILRHVGGMKLHYAMKDTLLKAIIIQVMGAVVMILREKFVLTEEQLRLPWKERAIATYKILWNGRFIQTPRPAPVYHLIKEKEGNTTPNRKKSTKNNFDTTTVNCDGMTTNSTLKDSTAPTEIWSFARHQMIQLWASHRFRWLLKSAIHLVLVVFIDDFKSALVLRYLRFGYSDVTEEKRFIILRLIQGKDVPLRETIIRCYFAFEGIWGAYNWFTRVHLACALFFVGIGIDEPEEWPPMFGDIRQAWNLRRFWSKYFDRLIYRSVAGWAEMILEFTGFGQRPFRGKKRWVLNGIIFTISGVFHGYTDLLNGMGCAFWWEIAWWVGNFVAICGETALISAMRNLCPRVYSALSGKIGKTIGFMWVWCWLWWSAPINQFVAIRCMPRY